MPPTLHFKHIHGSHVQLGAPRRRPSASDVARYDEHGCALPTNLLEAATWHFLRSWRRAGGVGPKAYSTRR
jgi:hypothetical protein